MDAAQVESSMRADECALDCASEISLADQEYLKDVRPADEPVLMRGINGGLKKLDRQGHLHGYGDVYAYQKGDGTGIVSNIMCFAEMEDRHTIDWEQSKHRFTVKMEDCNAIFDRRGKLYVGPLKLRAEPTLAQSLVTTVMEREESYGKLEVKKAREARAFMRKAGCASEKDAVRMAEDGNIRDVPVTGQDVRRCVAIYGPDPAAVKGKTTKFKTAWQRPDTALMAQRSCQTMHGDIMKVGKNHYLFVVAKPLDLKITTRVASQSAQVLAAALEDQVRMLRAFGFNPTMLLCDPQSSLRALRGHFPGMPVMPSGAGDGVPVADVGIRNHKNIVRSTQAALPWELPPSLEDDLVRFSTARLNMRRSHASDTRAAPRVKLTGIKPTYKGEFELGFGEYCEVPDVEVLKKKSNDALVDRSISAIALFPAGNAHESWWFLNVETKKRIQRSVWRPMVTTQRVVDAMDAMALSERGGAPHEQLVSPEAQLATSEHTAASGSEETTHVPSGTVYVERGGSAETTPEQDEPQRGVTAPTDGVPEPTQGKMDGVTEPTQGHTDGVAEPTQADESPQEPDEDPPASPRNSVTVEDASDDEDDADDATPSAAGAALDAIAEEAARAATDPVQQTARRPGRQHFERRAKSRASAAAKEAGHTVRHTLHAQKAKIIAGRRMPVRYSLHTMSVKAGVAEHGADALAAARAELKQLLLTKKAMHPVHRDGLSRTKVKKMIRSSMFLKAKFDAMGRFQKIKARLVANGKQQDRELYPDVSSPTVALQSVMMLLTICANKNQKVASIDIGGAYLNAEMTGEEVIMELDPLLVKIALQVDPSLKPYVDSRGKLVVVLDRALYGCVQSAKLWYDKLSEVLEAMGFAKNPVDQCVFNRGEGDQMCTLSVYVDDILALCKDETQLEGVISGLRDAFDEVTAEISNDFSYLGMHIKITEGQVSVSMEGYIEELLREYKVDKGSTAPAKQDLFEEGDGARLTEKEREEFHGAVAKLLYLSMRVKPEMLVAVIYLCTRVNCATVDDAKKLRTALQYVYHTREEGIVLDGKDITRVTGMIDASFAQHGDGKSHTGLAVMIGQACVMAKSSKQKIVTKDSTEAELVGLSDMLCHVMKCHEFMVGQGLPMETPELAQDNTSTISLVTKGGGRWRNKYLRVRQAMVKEMVDEGDVCVQYTPTELMTADVLTKALRGALFRLMSNKIRGTAHKPTGCVRQNQGEVY